MIDRFEELKAAFDAEHAKRPYHDSIAIQPTESRAFILITVDGERRGHISYNDITSPVKPWSVRIGRLRELKFSSATNLAKGSFWNHDLNRRP